MWHLFRMGKSDEPNLEFEHILQGLIMQIAKEFNAEAKNVNYVLGKVGFKADVA